MTGFTAVMAGAPSEVRARLPRWLLVGGVVVAALGAAIAVALPLVDGADSVLSRLTVVCFVIGMTALVLTGCALLQRDRSHPMGWWLVFSGIAGLVSRLVVGALVALEYNGADLPAALLWLVNWVWVPAQFALFELLLRFPSGRLPGRGWRVAEALGVAWLLVALTVVALVPGPLGAEPLDHVENPFGIAAASDLLTSALGPVFLAGNAVLIIGCAAPVWRWVRSGGGSRERAQLRWVLTAVIVTALSVPAAVLGGALELVEAAASLALPAAIAVAVHRDGLWGLGSILRRSLVYATATAVLAAGYLIFVLTWSAPAAPLLAALVIAMLALPVRNTAAWLLSRLLYGRRGDPESAIATLADGLQRAAESPAETIVRVVADSLRVPRVAIEDVRGRVIAEVGRTERPINAGDLRVELAAHGAPAGWLVVAERAPGEGLDAEDRQLVAHVLPQAGLIARAEELTEQLGVSYATLVSAREDERARLQRELHDELGPSLGSIVMQSEAARNLTRGLDEAGPDAVHRLDDVLDAIGATAETLVGDVRRIIAELRPVSLQAQGLAVALAEAVAALAPGMDSRVEVVADDLGLSADGELAVFRVVTEAVRNAFRHAQAGVLDVCVDRDDDLVVVRIEDDGIGIGDAAPGVGVRSMRERVEALGGTFTVGAGPGSRGTLVRAVIPRTDA